VSKVATHAAASSESKVKSSGRKSLGKSKGHQNIKKVIRDRFELKRKIGAGGMGAIYKAVDLIMVEANDRNPYLAIKILREELKNNAEAFKALQREYRKALKLAHPNIVQVYDFDRDGDLIYMTMEYLEGKDLEKVLRTVKGEGLPFAKAFSIIAGICDALIHAHQHKYIHYDFKPGNIFITSMGVAKVFDFGISRAVQQEKKFVPVGNETCFEPKSFTALTPTYASPEMINGETPDVRDDVYALAVVTYEVLSGSHPFDRIPASEARDKQMEPRRIEGLTNKQWATLRAGLDFERVNRVPTVDAFRDGMLNIVPERRLMRRAVFGVGFLLIAMIQAVAISTTGETDSDSPTSAFDRPVVLSTHDSSSKYWA
jgi:serine/threonine protein kinase